LGPPQDLPLAVQKQYIDAFLAGQLERLSQLPLEDLLAKRYQRLMSYGNR
jgi:acetyl-CoA carboxylase alpha subunit